MVYLFRATTNENEGYTLKILSDLLQFYIKAPVCLVFQQKGIFIDAVDTIKQSSVLVETALHAENFTSYECPKTLVKSTNLMYLQKMLKLVKKKDIVILSIKEEQPNSLCIELQSKDARKPYTTSHIVIQDAQRMIIDKHEDYGRPVSGTASNFQKICNAMSGVNRIIQISYNGKNLFQFFCDNGGITNRSGDFGDDDSDSEEDESPHSSPTFLYQQTFSTPYITRLKKIAGLNRTVKILPPLNNQTYLCFRMNAGGLGDLSIYMKSQKQQATEVSEEEDE
jgi:hypothetical protein